MILLILVESLQSQLDMHETTITALNIRLFFSLTSSAGKTSRGLKFIFKHKAEDITLVNFFVLYTSVISKNA